MTFTINDIYSLKFFLINENWLMNQLKFYIYVYMFFENEKAIDFIINFKSPSNSSF